MKQLNKNTNEKKTIAFCFFALIFFVFLKLNAFYVDSNEIEYIC